MPIKNQPTNGRTEMCWLMKMPAEEEGRSVAARRPHHHDSRSNPTFNVGFFLLCSPSSYRFCHGPVTMHMSAFWRRSVRHHSPRWRWESDPVQEPRAKTRQNLNSVNKDPGNDRSSFPKCWSPFRAAINAFLIGSDRVCE